MSEKPVIKCRNVGLRYPLHSRSLRIGLTHLVGRTTESDYWALQGIDLDVYDTEVIGIIGSNGSGKSTLARMVAGVYEPDTGSIEIEGSVNLLTLGTGFSPELTGRENIFINGAFHGYSRRQIASKEDQIIEFADIGSFIDQPIKMYSSGMRSRLAFSIAVSMDPEILIIDEALSTGDTAFRKKAQARVTSMVNRAKCVLIVSHQMSFLKEVCTRLIWLDKGKLVMQGAPAKVIQRYHQATGVED